MSRLFDPGLVYPCDDVGPWVEVTGPVTGTGDPLSDSVRVDIDSEHGAISGYARGPMADHAKRARRATIRVYDSGGGFYPDNDVTSLFGMALE